MFFNSDHLFNVLLDDNKIISKGIIIETSNKL